MFFQPVSVLYAGSTGKIKMVKQNVHPEHSGALEPTKKFHNVQVMSVRILENKGFLAEDF